MRLTTYCDHCKDVKTCSKMCFDSEAHTVFHCPDCDKILARVQD